MPARLAPLLPVALLLVPLLAATPARPSPGAGGLALFRATADISRCDREAIRAARRFGIPAEILLAIGRVESGLSRNGTFAPWPWTINAGGKGLRFRSRGEAVRHARRLVENGTESFDAGCFQINFRWHRNRFSSLDEMFDPRRNAEAAAGYLADLLAEFGRWPAAIAAYHSRQPARGRAYLARVERARRGLAPHRRPGAPAALIAAPAGSPARSPAASSPGRADGPRPTRKARPAAAPPAPDGAASRKGNLPLVDLSAESPPLF